jgi:hypothetical protein
MKRLAIVQSNYIPWKGYFDLINAVDEFILFDDAQYTKHDWRNRNTIKTVQGMTWLTIPVEIKGKLQQKIRDARVCDQKWRTKHWKSISQSYRKAPYFDSYKSCLEELYLGSAEQYLSEINYRFLAALCPLLGIHTPLIRSSCYELVPGKTERLVALCQQAGATEYLSGPAAKNYLDEALFTSAGIRVRWMDYSGYPEYPQLFPPFAHAVSVLDLLLNVGPDAKRYMKSFSPPLMRQRTSLRVGDGVLP